MAELFLSIDTLLNKYAKNVKAGETVTFNLIKGSNLSSLDPLDPKASCVDFPLVAKFGYEKPNLATTSHRMYEQKVPLADDSEDEAPEESSAEIHKDGGQQSWAARKKRRRRSRPDRRQWILEAENEFMESLGLHQKKKSDTADSNSNGISSKYVGVAESNSSSYFLFEVHPSTKLHLDAGDKDFASSMSTAVEGQPPTDNPQHHPQLNIRVIEVQGFQNFHQPSKVHTLSMQEAENLIGDQRAQITRFMMHAKTAAASQASTAATSRLSSLGGKGHVSLAKSRLFTKLMKKDAGDDDDGDDDDVMADLKFSNRKKGVRARQELLETLGDGLAVDDDGVLGGAHDSEFAGKRSFGRIQVTTNNSETAAGVTAAPTQSSTFEGNAMSDDFYQRDVQAEYEDLDFDANDQFDDDEVDQTEEIDGSGVVGDDEEEESDSDDEEEGVSGLATLAGLKALMAKARGETPLSIATTEEAATAAIAGKRTATREDGAGNVTSDQSSDEELPANKRPRIEEQKQASEATKPAAPTVDETGQRIISLEAIRKEIWLHHGQIKTKTLLKIFNIKRRSPEHRKLFQEFVKELCTISKTVEGNVLVLKQHYAK